MKQKIAALLIALSLNLPAFGASTPNVFLFGGNGENGVLNATGNQTLTGPGAVSYRSVTIGGSGSSAAVTISAGPYLISSLTTIILKGTNGVGSITGTGNGEAGGSGATGTGGFVQGNEGGGAGGGPGGLGVGGAAEICGGAGGSSGGAGGKGGGSVTVNATRGKGSQGMVFRNGSGGGGGGAGDASGSVAGGAGGAGGAAVALVAKGAITIEANASVSAKGAVGSNGISSANGSGGGGAGAGGFVLVASGTSITQAGLIDVGGGNGGNGGNNSGGGAGGGSGGYVVRWAPVINVSGTTTVSGGSAGNGGSTAVAGGAGGSGQAINITGTPSWGLITWFLDDGFNQIKVARYERGWLVGKGWAIPADVHDNALWISQANLAQVK